jgi:hypothetical protein
MFSSVRVIRKCPQDAVTSTDFFARIDGAAMSEKLMTDAKRNIKSRPGADQRQWATKLCKGM